VALTVSSLILGATYSSYLAAVGAWNRSRAARQQYQHARVALSIMERYLRCAVEPDSDASIVFEGEGLEEEADDEESPASDTLLFTSGGGSLRAASRGVSDFCELAFFIGTEGDSDVPVLAMEKRPVPIGLLDSDDDYDVAVLAVGVVEFDVDYFDGEEWLDDWVFQTGLPGAVEVSLTIESEGGEEWANPVTLSKLIVIETANKRAGSTALAE